MSTQATTSKPQTKAIQVTPSRLAIILEIAVRERRNVLIAGRPGIGKSAIPNQIAQYLNYDIATMIPAVMDAPDIMGLPTMKDGKAIFAPFGILHQVLTATRPTILFIDDLGQADITVQKGLMQFILARECNGHRLPDCVTVIAATNRRQDKAGVTSIIQPLLNRFHCIVELTTSADDWARWAVKANIRHDMVAFARSYPKYIETDFSNEHNEIAPVCTPRSLEFAAQQLDLCERYSLDSQTTHELISAAIGHTAAIDYRTFSKAYADLPSWKDITTSPKTCKVPTYNNPSALYAVSALIATKCNEHTISACVEYCERLPVEFGQLAIHDATRRDKELTETRAVIDWHVKHPAA